MPRFRSRGRSGRKTIWAYTRTGRSGSTIGPGAAISVATLLDQASGYLATATDPTLIRVRGTLIIDPEFSPSDTSAQWVEGIAAIMCQQSTPSGTPDDNLGAESVLWSGMFGQSMNRTILQGSGTDPNVDLLGEYVSHHSVLEYDVKAQRRLGDQLNLYLVVWSSESSSPIGFRRSASSRMLLME